MSSSESLSKGAFCVCHTTERSEHKLIINYVSDSIKRRSIKLPEYMIKISEDTEAKISTYEENVTILGCKQQLDIIIGNSLNLRYGPKKPMVYMTEDEQDLVMNVYIQEDQLEALRRLPLKGERSDRKLTAKRYFLTTVLNVVQDRIVSIVGSEFVSSRNGWVSLPDFQIHLLNENFMPRSEARATKAQLIWVVKGPFSFETPEQAMERERSMLLPKSIPIRPGDHLFTLGCRDDDLGRAIYFNVTISDHPQAIKLSPFVANISEATPAEARKMAASLDIGTITNMIYPSVFVRLGIYHLQREAEVFWAKNNTDLIIKVPIHISHAPLIGKCFLNSFFTMSLFLGMLMYYSSHFSKKSPEIERDFELNEGLYRLNGVLDQETGDRATDEDIHSVLFKRKGTQRTDENDPDHCDQMMEIIRGQSAGSLNR